MRDRRSRVWLFFVPLLALYVIAINHGLPNRDIIWSNDGNPLEPLIVAKRVFLDGWNAGYFTAYPNFHHCLLLIFLTPYMFVQHLLGNLSGLKMERGYPYGLEHFDTIFMHIAIITRLVSAAMAVGTVYWVYRTGRALVSQRAGIFAALAFGLSPSLIYYSHTETLDVPMHFWLSAAIYCYSRILDRFQLRHYVWLAICAAVSTATKDYAYGVFVLMPISMICGLAKHRFGFVSARALIHSILDMRHFAAIAVFLLSFAVAENWLWNFRGFVNHAKLASGRMNPDRIGTRLGRSDALSPERLKSNLAAMPFVLGWVGSGVCAVGLVTASGERSRKLYRLTIPILSCYYFTVVQALEASETTERPYMPIGLMLALFGGSAMDWLWSLQPLPLGRSICSVFVCGMFVNGAAVDWVLINDPRYAAEQWISANVPTGERIELFGSRVDMPRLTGSWNAAVVNHKSGTDSDVQLAGKEAGTQGFDSRGAAYLVVSRRYANRFLTSEERSGWSRRGETDFETNRDFVQGLDDGSSSFKEVNRLESTVAKFLRFPMYVVPELAIYERFESDSVD